MVTGTVFQGSRVSNFKAFFSERSIKFHVDTKVYNCHFAGYHNPHAKYASPRILNYVVHIALRRCFVINKVEAAFGRLFICVNLNVLEYQ